MSQPETQRQNTGDSPVESSALLGHNGTINVRGEVWQYECTPITDKAEIERLSGLDESQAHRFRSVGSGCISAFLNALSPEDHIRCLSREGHPGIPWPIVSQALHAARLQVVSETQCVVDRDRRLSIWMILSGLYSWMRCGLWPNDPI